MHLHMDVHTHTHTYTYAHKETLRPFTKCGAQDSTTGQRAGEEAQQVRALRALRTWLWFLAPIWGSSQLSVAPTQHQGNRAPSSGFYWHCTMCHILSHKHINKKEIYLFKNPNGHKVSLPRESWHCWGIQEKGAILCRYNIFLPCLAASSLVLLCFGGLVIPVSSVFQLISHYGRKAISPRRLCVIRPPGLSSCHFQERLCDLRKAGTGWGWDWLCSTVLDAKCENRPQCREDRVILLCPLHWHMVITAPTSCLLYVTASGKWDLQPLRGP